MGTRPLVDHQPVLDWITASAAKAQLVTSVCTGSLLYAKAGLLDGKRATTHWGALDLLGTLGSNLTVDRESRYVDDGIVTSAGVSAGIDMSFYVVEKLCGAEVADETAHYIDYPRKAA
jgi:transcriptional regulator GlxA family with amidase domain